MLMSFTNYKHNVVMIPKSGQMVPTQVSRSHGFLRFVTQTWYCISDYKHHVVSDALYFIFIIAQSMA